MAAGSDHAMVSGGRGEGSGPRVAAIETSTARGSVAWWSGGEVRFREAFEAGRGQAGLFAALARLREVASGCDMVAVGIGPGGYSGMRVGAAAAIGLRWGLGGELLGIPSVLGYGEGRYTVLGDARRGEGYFVRVNGNEIVEGPVFVPLEGLLAAAEDGGPIYAPEQLPGVEGVALRHPDAGRLAELAARGEGIAQRGGLAPLYVRAPSVTVPKDNPRLLRG